MKDILDARNMDYRVLIFDVNINEGTLEEENDKDVEEIRLELAT